MDEPILRFQFCSIVDTGSGFVASFSVTEGEAVVVEGDLEREGGGSGAARLGKALRSELPFHLEF